MPELARLQAWMQAVITHPCCAADGVASEEAQRHFPESELTRLVKPGPRLSSLERIAVYQEMQLPRMLEALTSDYPSLAALMGEHDFTHLVRDYVQVHGSRSYTLNRLGDHLPDYLETWGAERGRKRRADLARLELAITEVFDEEETAPLEASALAAIPADGWAGARLVPIAALRLVELRTNAVQAREAIRAGEPVPPSRPRKQWVMVHRRDDIVRCRPLRRPEALLLTELRDGRPLGQALSALLSRRVRLSASALASFTAGWTADGLLREIVVGQTKLD